MDNLCHSNGPNPSLTIISAVAFDKVVVYNRKDGFQYRIEGATITATVDGVSSWTTYISFHLRSGLLWAATVHNTSSDCCPDHNTCTDFDSVTFESIDHE